MKHTKRAIIMSFLMLLFSISMLVGTTFAYFTDSFTVRNKIHTGTLKVDLEVLEKGGGWTSLKASEAPIFDYDNWEPGYVDAKILKIENEGNLALKCRMLFVKNGDFTDLANVIHVFAKSSETEFGYPETRETLYDEQDGWQYLTDLNTFISVLSKPENALESSLVPKEEANADESLFSELFIGFALVMDPEATIVYNGMSLGGTFDIVVDASQVGYEEDSFGSDYDENATFPDFGDIPPVSSDSEIATGTVVNASGATTHPTLTSLPAHSVPASYKYDTALPLLSDEGYNILNIYAGDDGVRLADFTVVKGTDLNLIAIYFLKDGEISDYILDTAITEDNFLFTKVDTDTVGEKSFESAYVSPEGYIFRSEPITVTVVDPPIVDIEFSNSKNFYYVGQSLKPEDLGITAVYSNGDLSFKKVPEYIQLNGIPETFTEEGTYTYSVYCSDGTHTYLKENLTIEVRLHPLFTFKGASGKGYYVFNGTDKYDQTHYTKIGYADTDLGAMIVKEIDGAYYIMPDVSGASSAVYGSIVVNGETVYYPIVNAYEYESGMADVTHFPIFGGVSILDSSRNYSLSTSTSIETELPSGLQIVEFNKSFISTKKGIGAAGHMPKYYIPETLYYYLDGSSFPTFLHSTSNEVVAKFAYTAENGVTYTYYVGYQADAVWDRYYGNGISKMPWTK